MIPNNTFGPDTRFRQLVEAIKFVYASTFYSTARQYRKATGHRDEEERMAVIIQELVGKRYHTRFYPELSGVARSYNYYPMPPSQPGECLTWPGIGQDDRGCGVSWCAARPSASRRHPSRG
jgi:phosphoenolpyruvate synthase/pyruvate phosphate dikinase